MPKRINCSLDRNIIFLAACSSDHLRLKNYLPTRSPPPFVHCAEGTSSQNTWLLGPCSLPLIRHAFLVQSQQCHVKKGRWITRTCYSSTLWLMSCPTVSTVGKPLLLHIRSSWRRKFCATLLIWKSIGSKSFAMGWRSQWAGRGRPATGYIGALQLKKRYKKTHLGMMGFSSSDNKAASKGGGGIVEENALQASLFDRSSSTVGGEDNAVNKWFYGIVGVGRARWCTKYCAQ